MQPRSSWILQNMTGIRLTGCAIKVARLPSVTLFLHVLERMWSLPSRLDFGCTGHFMALVGVLAYDDITYTFSGADAADARHG